MICRNCGRKIKDGSMFCKYCGAQQSYEGAAYAIPEKGRKAGTNKNGRSKGPGRVILMLLLFLLLVGVGIAAAVLWRSSAPDGEEGMLSEEEPSEPGPFRCTLCLSANDTHFYLGEEAVPQFTLTVPQDIEGLITVSDEEGAIVYEVDASAMEQNGMGARTASFSLEQDTSSDHIKEYTASAGENYSSPLSIYITPVITEEMVGESIEIALQAHDYVDAGDPGRTTEEKAAAALEWFEKNERVAAAEITEDGQNVFFVTTDSVGTLFQTEPDNEWAKNYYAGIDEGETENLEEWSPLAILFSQVGTEQIDENNPVLFQETSGSMVSTDPDVLLLMPCPDAMNARVCEDLREDTRILANGFGSTTPTILENNDAIYAILRKNINTYGLITLFTHGGTSGSDKREGNYTHYLLCEQKFTGNDKQEIVTRFKEKLHEYAEIGYQADNEGKDSQDDFYSTFYSEKKPWNNKRPRIYLAISDKECKLRMTGKYLMDRYQDQFFDNTIFYIATCHGFEYRTLNEFLISHGCRYVLGFLDTAAQGDIRSYYQRLAEMLPSSPEAHPDHTDEMLEAFGKIGRLHAHWSAYIKNYAMYQVLEDILTRSRNTGNPPDWSDHSEEYRRYVRQKFQEVYGSDWGDYPTYTKIGDVYVETGKTYEEALQEDNLSFDGTEGYLQNKAFSFVNGHLQESDRSNADIQNLLQAWKDRITLQYIEDNRGRTIGELLQETAAAQVPAAEAAIQSALPQENRQETLLEVLIGQIQEEEWERQVTQFWDEDAKKWINWYISTPTSMRLYNKKAIPSNSQDDTLYYLTSDNPVFALKGIGTFTGTVVVQDLDEDGNPVGDPVPAVGAEVTAYLLRNHAYSEVGKVKADEQGVFLFEDLPNGHLIMQAGLDSYASMPYSTYFVEGKGEAWQGGEIRIDRPPKEEIVCSAPIGEYAGTEYVIPKMRGAEYLDGLVTLPVECPALDHICSFAFYRGKLYLCCKGEGTSDYGMALYECNPDGTEMRKLTEMSGTAGHIPQMNLFVIRDGTLYYIDVRGMAAPNIRSIEYAIDLETGESRTVMDGSNIMEEGALEIAMMIGHGQLYKGGYYYYVGDATPNYSYIYWGHHIVRYAETETEAVPENQGIVSNEGALVKLEGVTTHHLYYSTSDNSTFQVYRVDLDPLGENGTFIGSRPAGGGGGYFAW